MKINYVIPVMEPKKFTGGILCLYEYIRGLAERGHDVSVIPLIYFGAPDWIDLKAKIIKPHVLPEMGYKAVEYAKFIVEFSNRDRTVFNWLDSRKNALRVAQNIPACDINVATSYETALPVYLSGRGKMFYFMQHFEELFTSERPSPGLARYDAMGSYALPIQKIANSTWLKGVMKEKFDEDVPFVTPCINTQVFTPTPADETKTHLRVVSFGGGNRQWKGFLDAAEAMKIVRQRLGKDIEWLVFDKALLPPDNPVAPYTQAGFVTGKKLAAVYTSADVTLCPSYYESFPLYPIEAMACGSAVVTTPLGVEDYAKDNENCVVVQPRNPQQMAEAVILLLQDGELRQRLSQAGIRTAQQHSRWSDSVAKLESIFQTHV